MLCYAVKQRLLRSLINGKTKERGRGEEEGPYPDVHLTDDCLACDKYDALNKSSA
jgi:hypothetical protein